jgi:hypothetical protein
LDVRIPRRPHRHFVQLGDDGGVWHAAALRPFDEERLDLLAVAAIGWFCGLPKCE